MNISGIYTYEDDGVINPDNINLVPGSLIPVAPNSRGLTPLAGVGRFDVAQLILGDMRQNIRKALYMETLGPDQRNTNVSYRSIRKNGRPIKTNWIFIW